MFIPASSGSISDPPSPAARERRPAKPRSPQRGFLTPPPSPAFPDLCRAARLLPGQLRRTLATGQQRLGVRLEITVRRARSMKASLIMLAGRPVRGGAGFFGKLLLVPVDQVGRNVAGLALRGFSVSGLLREGNLRSRSLGGGGLPRPESKRCNSVRHENASPSGVAGPWRASPQSVR